MHHTLPIVAVNGLVDGRISPLDRGFAFGDGLFETCKLIDAKIPLWDLHSARLIRSANRLLIPLDIDLIEHQLSKLLSAISRDALHDAVVKITVTRGEGGRGYRIPDNVSPTLVMGVYPSAKYSRDNQTSGVTVRVCDQRLSRNSSLAGLKHLNRLETILARSEWIDDSIAEGILLDTEGFVTEAVFSNLFLVKNNQLLTPDLSLAGVEGIMRQLIIETLAPAGAIPVQITSLTMQDLIDADAIFLCNSLYGIWPVRKLMASREFHFGRCALTAYLQDALAKELMIRS